MKRTKVSRKSGRKRSEGSNEGAKEGRISDIKVGIVESLISHSICLSSFVLHASVVLQIVVNKYFLCEIMYRFVRITISKMMFLLFDTIDASYSDGSCPEKDNAIVKA